jgi:hypothetical protein
MMSCLFSSPFGSARQRYMTLSMPPGILCFKQSQLLDLLKIYLLTLDETDSVSNRGKPEYLFRKHLESDFCLLGNVSILR